MLSLIGDILNWLAAGVVFPLMLLPLAAMAERPRTPRRNAAIGALAWGFLIVVIGSAAMIFAHFAPRLDYTPSARALIVLPACAAFLMMAVVIAGGARKMTAILARIFEAVTRGAGRAVMWLVLAMALVQFAVVILRYVFGVNFIFMQESITYMHGAVFLLAAGYALLTDDHVRVDIFYRNASAKRKALIDLLGTYFLLFPVCLLILWTSSEYVGNSWAVREGSAEQSGIQGVFLLKSLIPAFATLMAMGGFVNAARAGAALRGEEV